ncbi:hypothetical protein EW146_g4853 [Bondarzewia mesenterica]|uniref:Amine oxidase n=1 Tax=Bondarzewia mesenterica TaxID=1095465 RepID=A0A4S4LV38_9AGAM|nr:hypothetical protein EW146_g4853 [Bondarzewia mesenterica]
MTQFLSCHAFLIIFTGLLGFVSGRSTTLSSFETRDDGLPARVPYVFPPPGTDPIADAIRARRENGTLLDLDGVLLNAPLVAQGWNAIASVIRDNNTIPATMRELFVSRETVEYDTPGDMTCYLGPLDFTLRRSQQCDIPMASINTRLQHESVGRGAGLTSSQLQTIRFAPPFVGLAHEPGEHAQASNETLSPSLAAALDFADWSTKAVRIPQKVYDNLRVFLTDKQMVEATATVGMYNFPETCHRANYVLSPMARVTYISNTSHACSSSLDETIPHPMPSVNVAIIALDTGFVVFYTPYY